MAKAARAKADGMKGKVVELKRTIEILVRKLVEKGFDIRALRQEILAAQAVVA